MQCVPWPLPSSTGSPGTKEADSLDAPGQVRVVGVHAGVEDGDLHIAPGQAGQVGPDRLQAPGPFLLVQGRAQGRRRFRPWCDGRPRPRRCGRPGRTRSASCCGAVIGRGVDHALRLCRDDRGLRLGRGHQRVALLGPHLDDGGAELLEEHRDVGALKEFGDVRGLGSPDTFDGRDVGGGTQRVQPDLLVTRVEQDHVSTCVLRALARDGAIVPTGMLAEGAPVHGSVRH